MANIISLTLENFRSYKEETTFTLEAVEDDAYRGNYHDVKLADGKNIRLLNSAVLYGANAAGKSTIITGFLALSSFIYNSDRYKPKKKLTYEPFKFSSETDKAPIKIGVEFVAKDEVYSYRISYDETSFLTEELRRKRDDFILFQRNEDGNTILSPELGVDFSEASYPANHLAMSELALKIKEDNLLYPIYETLSSIETVQMSKGYFKNYDIQEAARIIHDNPKGIFGKIISNLIVEADAGIAGISVKELEEKDYGFTNEAPSDFKSYVMENHPYDVNMIHQTEKGGNVSLPIDAESEGTKTLFTAGTRVVKALMEGSFLAYDEMNIALHPKLFFRLIELFNSKETNPNNAQLIVTTHDTYLIDEYALRADQIWFVEKNKNGESSIYSAIDFDDISIDDSVGPWYRSGRLGARPNLKSLDRFSIKG